MAVLRFGVGADYFAYSYIYTLFRVRPLSELINGGPTPDMLFNFIGNILRSIGIPYQLFIASIAIINILFIYRLVQKESNNPILSLLTYYSFFYFVWTFSALRQGLVLTVGIYYLFETYHSKNDKKMLLVITILTGIHASALFLLVLYILMKYQWNQKSLSILSFSSILFSLIPLSNILILLEKIPVLNRIQYYITFDNTAIDIIDKQSLLRIFLIVFILFLYESIIKMNQRNQIILNVYILGLSSYFILKSSELVAARISIYGYYLIILIVPMIYNLFKEIIKKEYILLLIVGISFISLQKELMVMERQSGLMTKYEVYVPYTNVYNKYKGYFFESRHEPFYFKLQKDSTK